MKLGKAMKIFSTVALVSLLISGGTMAAEEKEAGGEGEKGVKNYFMVPRTEGSLPSDPWDAAWDQYEKTTFDVTGQAAIQPRLFNSSVKSVNIWSLHNDKKIAILMEYEDASKDVDVNGNSDAAAVMFPIEPLPKRAHIYMGEPMLQVESSYANIWHWKAKDNKGVDLTSEGIVGPPMPQESQDVKAVGEWKNNKWRVLFTRDMITSDSNDSKFVSTQFANVSFATWDAIKGETKSMHGMTAWYYMVPEAQEETSTYLMYGLMGVAIAGVLELAFVKSVQKKKTDDA